MVNRKRLFHNPILASAGCTVVMLRRSDSSYSPYTPSSSLLASRPFARPRADGAGYETASKRQPGESGEALGVRLRHAALGLLFLLSSGPAGLTNVLCIGADGHISLEQAASPCCGDLAAAPGPRERTASSLRPLRTQAREDCGDCLDIPLAAAGTVATARHSSGAAAILQLNLELGEAALAECEAEYGRPPCASSARADVRPPPPRAALSHLRAVILRR